MGLGQILTTTLLHEGRAEDIARFSMDTLAENRCAIASARLLGGERSGSDGTVLSYSLDVGGGSVTAGSGRRPAVYAPFRD